MTVAKAGAGVACAAVLFAGSAAAGRPHHHRHHRHPRPPQPKPVAALGVHESEYKIRLSRQALQHGRVVVQLRNLGQDPHDLVMAPESGSGPTYSFPVGDPGSTQSQTLTLSAGTWHLYCSLPGHEALGMSATITVN